MSRRKASRGFFVLGVFFLGANSQLIVRAKRQCQEEGVAPHPRPASRPRRAPPRWVLGGCPGVPAGSPSGPPPRGSGGGLKCAPSGTQCIFGRRGFWRDFSGPPTGGGGGRAPGRTGPGGKKPTALDRHDVCDPGRPERLGHRRRRPSKQLRVREHRRDVLEPDARLRKVGNVSNRSADLVGQRGHILRSVCGPLRLLRHVISRSRRDWVRSPARPADQPFRVLAPALPRDRCADAQGAHRAPPCRLRPGPRPIRPACYSTHPANPSDRARSRTNHLKPTPCTFPRTTTWQRIRRLDRPTRDCRSGERTNRRDVPLLDPVATPPVHHELLNLAVPDRNEETATIRQLVEKRLRHGRRPRADENRVERGVLSPPQRSVADEQRHVADAGALDVRAPACSAPRCARSKTPAPRGARAARSDSRTPCRSRARARSP